MDEVGGCHNQSASIKISFKILSAHTDGFLVGKFKGEGVPHIIRVNALNNSNDTANLIVTGNKCGSFAVFYSSRCGHNHIRFIAFHQLEIDKIVLGILLVSKTEDLSVLSVETIVGSIPKAHDAAFTGQQSDGISLGIV